MAAKDAAVRRRRGRRYTREKSGKSNMPLRLRRLAPLAASLVSWQRRSPGAPSLGLTQTRTQGYEISDDALLQIREGQSKELVTLVLGSPATTNTWGEKRPGTTSRPRLRRPRSG